MKALKITGIIIIILIVAAGGLLAYVKFALPDVGPPPDITVEITPERLERGEYLAHHVALCIDCHSVRDWNKFGAPPIEGTFGGGGESFKREWGFPGEYHAPNITPNGIGDWTDGELYRAIVSGVNKDGKALFPIMPYPLYGKLDKEDIYSIIAYIRTLKPIGRDNPESVSDFPMNFIINTIPSRPQHTEMPDKDDVLAYGEYLGNGCIECHTLAEKGMIIPELAYSGGREFALPTGGIVRSSNITPDPETGIGNWTKEQFVNKFKTFADSSYQHQTVGPNEFNSVMPWTMYAGVKEEDLKAIYAFLMTLKPIKNKVVRFTPDPHTTSSGE